MNHKYVYLFTEGNGSMRELLGGKGANLAEMTNIGLPVPQGFTISTEACTQYYEDGRANNTKLHIGICGEHGGDPTYVAFCHKLGLDYVSCSPFRVPIARLAAAQAAINASK